MKSILAWLPALMAVAVGVGTVGESVSFAAEDAIEITEWVVPWENTRPRDPYVDGQGRVWFVGQVGNYLAYLDPQTGRFERYELDAGTGPHNLIVDDDGFVWYAGNRASHIGRLDPKTGKLTKHKMPDTAAGDPHTLTFDGNGDIWFTVQRGNFVGKLGTRTGSIELVSVPTARARPYGIVVDGNNRAWFCELGTNKLASIDPETLELEEIELPRADTRPRRLQVASDGQLWYVDYTGGYLGRLDPVTGDIEEWLVPGWCQRTALRDGHRRPRPALVRRDRRRPESVCWLRSVNGDVLLDDLDRQRRRQRAAHVLSSSRSRNLVWHRLEHHRTSTRPVACRGTIIEGPPPTTARVSTTDTSAHDVS